MTAIELRPEDLRHLPDGTVVHIDRKPHVVLDGELHRLTAMSVDAIPPGAYIALALDWRPGLVAAAEFIRAASAGTGSMSALGGWDVPATLRQAAASVLRGSDERRRVGVGVSEILRRLRLADD